MSVANCLTLIRIIIGPIFLLTYLEYEALNLSFVLLPYVLLVLLGISELSDLCDGYFARKFSAVTDLGKILDPMADSIYRTSIFLTFTLPPISLPMIFVFIFFYRDSVLSTLRTLCALRGFALAARPSGKVKAALQGLAAALILLLLIPYSLGDLEEASLQTASRVIVAFASLYTVLSCLEYLYANRSLLSQVLFATTHPVEEGAGAKDLDRAL